MILLLALAPLSFGQAVSGSVIGRVVDSSGATVPNATITATNVDTGVKATTTTSAGGDYRLDNLLVGTYNLSASASGFTSTTLSNVDVQLNKTVTANVVLQVGQVTTTVEVTEANVAIDTSTAQVQSSFDSRQIVNMPIIENAGSSIQNHHVAPKNVLESAIATIRNAMPMKMFLNEWSSDASSRRSLRL